MKKQEKSGQKMTIAQFVLGAIRAKGLDKDGSKETLLPLVSEVKRKFSGTKFNLAHAHWYLSRYRRQRKDGLGVDRLHQLRPGKPAKAKKAKKAAGKTRAAIVTAD